MRVFYCPQGHVSSVHRPQACGKPGRCFFCPNTVEAVDLPDDWCRPDHWPRRGPRVAKTVYTGEEIAAELRKVHGVQ